MLRRKDVKAQSRASETHKLRRLVFNPPNQKFSGKLQKLLRNAFGVAAQVIIEQFLYAKKPSHLENNQAFSGTRTYEQVVSHLKKVQLNSAEAPDELLMNIVTQNATKPHNVKSKTTFYYRKRPCLYRN